MITDAPAASRPGPGATAGHLLDTHVVIDWQQHPDKIRPATHRLIGDGRARIVVSVVSIWEIAIKHGLGKLDVHPTLIQLVEGGAVDILPVTADHAKTVATLPLHHRDPFDRMLVAQAQHEQLTLLTADERLAAYPIDVWPA